MDVSICAYKFRCSSKFLYFFIVTDFDMKLVFYSFSIPKAQIRIFISALLPVTHGITPVVKKRDVMILIRMTRNCEY